MRSLRSSYRRVSVSGALEQEKFIIVEEEEGEEYEKDVTATSTVPADKIDRAYDATTSKGKPNGLFVACMEVIRSSHHEARQIRTALILVGLFTDPELYKEWLSVFYIVNLELEEKMKSADFEESLCNDENELTILKKLQELGNKYYFSELYEQDLQLLWGVSTREELLQKVDSCLANKPNAREYRSVVRNMTKASDLSGALFCLWGVFVSRLLSLLYLFSYYVVHINLSYIDTLPLYLYSLLVEVPWLGSVLSRCVAKMALMFIRMLQGQDVRNARLNSSNYGIALRRLAPVSFKL